jgi:hypothetical protein
MLVQGEQRVMLPEVLRVRFHEQREIEQDEWEKKLFEVFPYKRKEGINYSFLW